MILISIFYYLFLSVDFTFTLILILPPSTLHYSTLLYFFTLPFTKSIITLPLFLLTSLLSFPYYFYFRRELEDTYTGKYIVLTSHADTLQIFQSFLSFEDPRKFSQYRFKNGEVHIRYDLF